MLSRSQAADSKHSSFAASPQLQTGAQNPPVIQADVPARRVGAGVQVGVFVGPFGEAGEDRSGALGCFLCFR